ncbi:aldehyde dehydrogenase family protein [Achromobacter sp. UMC71]|uniref:aldehyde dehydrogenase family protein n=1 Tax=Achromobacter sp. UMC71 TaxID=1862320 RepID=UPI001C808E8E|nr:aldehyde dehydrogenase family protein [Achromobacter sp. UMC71]
MNTTTENLYGKNFIAGEWTSAARTVPNINPSDVTDIVGEFASADHGEVEQAIAAARQAFPTWALCPAQKRADILFKTAQLLTSNAGRIGTLLSREQGRPRPEAEGEVVRAAQIFAFFAGEVVRATGEIFPSTRPGAEVLVSREPIGVVAAITPWNVPIAIPAWKIAPALAYGNCMVLKPAELVPASALELVRILQEAGLPAGVLNLVMGSGSTIGPQLLDSPDIDAVSFTGSIATGKKIAAAAVAGGKKVQAEMGGKSGLVVLNDANLDIAIDCAIDGAFFWTGQRCTASSRLIVARGIYDEFVDRMIARMKTLRIDHAQKEGTEIGPVVDERQLAQNQRYIEIAKADGGEVIGGQRLQRDTQGFYMEPALILNTSNGMRINQEEVFGPVTSVLKVADYEEALMVANDTRFGLSSGICTDSLHHSTHFRRHSLAGTVAVNLTTTGSEYHVPFGGRKSSSYGAREQGRYAMDFYTAIKTSYVRA